MVGHVKLWNERKGYGFIVSGETEYYVKFRDLSDDFLCWNGRKNMDVGETVSFTPRRGMKGPYAVRVETKA